MIKLVDSHCHLDLIDLSFYEQDTDRMLDASREKGVDYFLCVGLNFKHSQTIIKKYASYDFIGLSAGLHPTENLNPAWEGQPETWINAKLEEECQQLLTLAAHPRVIALGETGLDFYRTLASFDQRLQRDRFCYHIAVAKKLNKPLIIHSRHARTETLHVLKQEKATGGVFHCFTEDWATAKAALDLGFYISFSGILTFKNAKDLQALASKIPSDRLLVETDAPYLAPVPYRGKPNMPGYTVYVAQKLASLRGVSFETIAEQTTQNFFRLFS